MLVNTLFSGSLKLFSNVLGLVKSYISSSKAIDENILIISAFSVPLNVDNEVALLALRLFINSALFLVKVPELIDLKNLSNFCLSL